MGNSLELEKSPREVMEKSERCKSQNLWMVSIGFVVSLVDEDWNIRPV